MRKAIPTALVLLLFLCIGLIGGTELRAEEQPVAALPEPVRAIHARCHWEGPPTLPAEAYDLAHGWMLYIVPCAMSTSVVYYSVYTAKADGTEIRRMLFVTWSDITHSLAATDVLGEAQYTPDTRVLSGYKLFRGLGDCGWSAAYEVVATDVGVEPRVREIRFKDVCDGKHPGKFPRVFPRN